MTSFTAADHVTEREPGSWEDCTFSSMLETMRLALPNGRNIPATIGEVNRYRAAAGYPDNHTGVTIEQTIPAAKQLYNLKDDDYWLTREWDVLEPALRMPSTVAVVTGKMSAVPATLRRWDPGFNGNHAVAARGGTVPMWCDPLAPSGTYKGEPVTIATWRSFFTALQGSQALVMKAQGGSVYAAGGLRLTSNKIARIIKAGDLLLEPGGSRLAAAVVGRKYPYMANVTGHRMILVDTPLPYPDKVSRPTHLFIVNALAVIEDAPVDPGGITDTGPAVQARWETWVETHPKG